jgi:hypothetical protein
MRRAFTVIELLVAVVVLLAVIIATSKVFNVASKVASTGEANADVLQQAAVLEQQMRRDLERICRDGFLAIQCVEVPNNVNAGAGGPLLNPALAADALIRCDQIVFFTAGNEISGRWAGPGDLASSGGGQQARATMVRYSHGVQIPRLTLEMLPDPGNFPPIVTQVLGGPGGVHSALVPWTWVAPGLQRAVQYRYGQTSPVTQPTPATPPVDPSQPEAREWVLARKTALLADDGGFAVFYPEPRNLALGASLGPSSAPSVFGDLSNGSDTPLYAQNTYRKWHWREARDRNWIQLSANLVPSPLLQSGWVDIAASDLDRIRRQIAPTLRLATSDQLDLPGLPGYVRSLSVPWSKGVPGVPGGLIGWPRFQGAPAWPDNASIAFVGNAQQAGTVAAYTSQRDRILKGCFGTPAIASPAAAGLLGWPRSEKGVSSSTDRRTEMLLSPTLLSNCSSFRVEWTWEPGTGRQTDSAGALLSAVIGLDEPPYNPAQVFVMRGYDPFAIGPWVQQSQDPPSAPTAQPWFGLPPVNPAQASDVTSASQRLLGHLVPHEGFQFEVSNEHMQLVAQTVEGVAIGNPAAVTTPFPGQPGVRVYSAVFGFNQDEASVLTPDGVTRVLRDDFTPWPTQIRVTATIHDRRLVLDRGREVQFVLDVPKRRKD